MIPPTTISEVCPEGLTTESKVNQTIAEAGFVVEAEATIDGAKLAPFVAVLSQITPPPAGYDNFKIRNFGARVMIDARNGTCSLGVIVIPTELFVALMQGIRA